MSSYVPFTQEEIDTAAHTDIKSILEARGEKVIKSGSEWAWAAHDSVKFRGHVFYRHSTGDKGTAVDFMCLFFDMSFQDAVLTLTGKDYGGVPLRHAAPVQMQQKAFQLPPRNCTMHRMYAYLMQERGISQDIITFFVRKHTLYESAERHNAVFVGCDTNGKPRAAHEKGTLSYRPYRADVPGSSKNYFFNFYGGPDRLYVFEAPIDMLSFVTMHRYSDWTKNSYLALGGISSRALLRFLLEHPYVRNIALCLDNDTVGQQADRDLASLLDRLKSGKAVDSLSPDVQKKLRRNYTVRILKSRLKDWNDDLINTRH